MIKQALLFFVLYSSVQTEHRNLDKSGLALEGYDPVAYFQKGAVIGSEKFQFTHNQATYYFSSSENKSLFEENPEKYLPMYGGWCAYALGLNPDKVRVDPETFKIVDNRLYLFYNFWGNNTLDDWNKDEKSLKIQADANWKKLTE